MITTSQRRQRILQLLKEQGNVQVSELSPLFGVSTVTIRHDLSFFEEHGIVTRNYGGAYLRQDVPLREPPERVAAGGPSAVDERIGLRAAELVRPRETLLVEAGAARFGIGAQLAQVRGITVMTNALRVADELAAAPDVQLLCTGGTWLRARGAFAGAQAEQALAEHRFQRLLLGADSLDPDPGITVADEAEARLQRAMMAAAAETIVLAASHAFGRRALHRVAALQAVSTVVTDTGLSHERRAALVRLGIDVVLVA